MAMFRQRRTVPQRQKIARECQGMGNPPFLPPQRFHEEMNRTNGDYDHSIYCNDPGRNFPGMMFRPKRQQNIRQGQIIIFPDEKRCAMDHHHCNRRQRKQSVIGKKSFSPAIRNQLYAQQHSTGYNGKQQKISCHPAAPDNIFGGKNLKNMRQV